MTKLQALHNNAARLILVFSLLASYERCIWEALSVEVIHEHLVVFIKMILQRLIIGPLRKICRACKDVQQGVMCIGMRC